MIQRVANALRQAHITIATAESCTGGLLGAALTQERGSSEYYLGGVISYANAAKERLLGVEGEILRLEGAVSAAVAGKMAVGIQRKLRAALGVATTGIAGPDGGSAEKPVGLVYIGLAGPDGVETRKFQFCGDRESIRQQTVQAALHWVLLYLEQRKGEH